MLNRLLAQAKAEKERVDAAAALAAVVQERDGSSQERGHLTRELQGTQATLKDAEASLDAKVKELEECMSQLESSKSAHGSSQKEASEMEATLKAKIAALEDEV
ncbi:hypothetical protein DUNSADRAFT_1539 [Dunaliella salina]|uniref:Uncharacterized protein n=1 Tax=Dunaliella salina TaxID=3046 RepID=A0ABQ7FXG4_DUNSA|nr:hypothetical protein DUNSADRAFT_1539 [Dunaliella salina]|eukprot:KAF5827007.1 hypothetical protein DUNSADRAFT_1539 [Dunaliella salina]